MNFFLSALWDGPEVLFNYTFCYLYVSQISKIRGQKMLAKYKKELNVSVVLEQEISMSVAYRLQTTWKK